MYFPDWFADDLNYLEKLRNYLKDRIEFELTGDPELIPRLISYRDFFLESSAPKSFNPFNSNNDLVQLDQQFESMAAALEENGIANVSELTIFEFYSRVKYFEKRSKK